MSGPRLSVTAVGRRLGSIIRAGRVIATATALTALLGAPSATAWATAEGAPVEAGQLAAAGSQASSLPLVLY